MKIRIKKIVGLIKTEKDYPEEYKNKEVEFFYRKFFINKNVLIPRLETESLVRETIKIVKENNISTLIDVGTGSGIIPISIGLEVPLKRIIAIDISRKALNVAKKNATNFNLNIEFYKSFLLFVFFKKEHFKFDSSVVITANLPYVREGDTTNLGKDVIFEPKKAIFGGKVTGFELYEQLILLFFDFINFFKPKVIFLVCEIGFDQKELAIKLVEKIGFKDYYFVKDTSGVERILVIKGIIS
ncbi:MAG: HemK family protein methyltransferase [Candidatus Gracilibacteria bacterium]|nr:HemK family protein methyltransferase [Candidatus Gracilibacteria bacterium]